MMTMRARFTQLLGLMVLAATAAAAADLPDEPLPFDLVEVSPSVILARNTNGSNLTCIAIEDGLVFVDTGLSTRAARRFRREMETRFDRPAIALVLTHAHVDHFLGMGAFADLPVHAAEAGRPRWEHFVGLEWDEKAIAFYGSVFPTLPDELPDASLRLPTDWFSDELVLGSGSDRVEIRRTGGHTIDSSSVLLGSHGIVVAGDLVQARRRPYFGEPDTDFEAWIETLKGWETLEIKAVCPGHGPLTDLAELSEIRVWFETTAAAVAKLKDRGVTMEEILTGEELPAGYWPDEDAVPRWWVYCVKRLYDAS